MQNNILNNEAVSTLDAVTNPLESIRILFVPFYQAIDLVRFRQPSSVGHGSMSTPVLKTFATLLWVHLPPRAAQGES